MLLFIIYLSFISLGLPDSLLGSAWPNMYIDFDIPLSYVGIISTIITGSTILSSLFSDKFNSLLGTGKVTTISVCLTALALFGFSISHSFIELCFWALPYGFGAGSVDASLNNYVAIHFESRHMSWLHCMWGVGTSIGPYIMSYVLTNGKLWNSGYRIISIIQIVLSCILLISLPKWKNDSNSNLSDTKSKTLTIKEIFNIKGVKYVLIAFFCYCALEQTAGLWATSYLNLYKNVCVQEASGYASLFYIGITLGRAISGFTTFKFTDDKMIKLGSNIILFGIVILLVNGSVNLSLIGFILIGLGCAPIYPCIMHSTPRYFGQENSQTVIGMQMACAYVGILLMPPLFGIIANYVNIALLPIYLLLLLFVMYISHHKLSKNKTE